MNHESSSAIANEVIRLRAENERLRAYLGKCLGLLHHFNSDDEDAPISDVTFLELCQEVEADTRAALKDRP